MLNRQAMAALAEFELIVLLAVLRSGDLAYSVAVRNEIERRTGRRASLGAVHLTLDRLERKGLLVSSLGDPTPQRGGRAKRYYLPTRTGVRVLKAECRVISRMWSGLGLLA